MSRRHGVVHKVVCGMQIPFAFVVVDIPLILQVVLGLCGTHQLLSQAEGLLVARLFCIVRVCPTHVHVQHGLCNQSN